MMIPFQGIGAGYSSVARHCERSEAIHIKINQIKKVA